MVSISRWWWKVFTWLSKDAPRYFKVNSLIWFDFNGNFYRNISVWAWSNEESVQQFILDALVNLINQCKSLLNNEVVAYLLSFLIEPTKSSQPIQHALIKDLIIRCTSQLEYPIQMVRSYLFISFARYYSSFKTPWFWAIKSLYRVLILMSQKMNLDLKIHLVNTPSS